MENCLLVIFDEICPETMYYSTGSLARFLSNFKNLLKNPILIRISSKFQQKTRIGIGKKL